MHRLHAARQMPALDDFRQAAQHLRFKRKIHGAVWLLPIAQHAQALEIGGLSGNLLGGVFTAFFTELLGIQLGADLAEFLFHG